MNMSLDVEESEEESEEVTKFIKSGDLIIKFDLKNLICINNMYKQEKTYSENI